jgi:type IV pilus assembly protein PilW
VSAAARRSSPRRLASGVTLIELMVAMVLGLIVAGAAMAVFLTNRQTYVATESLGRLQEGARVAFELMSRDLRAAGTIPCSDEATFHNVVNSGNWWSAWTSLDGGLVGYGSPDTAFPAASGTGGRVADNDDALFASGWSDAIGTMDATPPGADPIVITAAATAENLPVTLTVNNVDGVSAGDLLMACDYGYYDVGPPVRQRSPAAVVFQATSAAGTSITAETSGSPGNDATDPFVTSTTPNLLQPNGLVSVLHATRWYIGHNAVGGTSLYRSVLRNTTGTPAAVDEEIVRGADGLAVRYLEDGDSTYGTAASVGDWGDVIAVRIQLHLSGTDLVDGERVQRTLEHVVTIRNRAQ